MLSLKEKKKKNKIQTVLVCGARNLLINDETINHSNTLQHHHGLKPLKKKAKESSKSVRKESGKQQKLMLEHTENTE